jgi:hypothetical protein
MNHSQSDSFTIYEVEDTTLITRNSIVGKIVMELSLFLHQPIFYHGLYRHRCWPLCLYDRASTVFTVKDIPIPIKIVNRDIRETTWVLQ